MLLQKVIFVQKYDYSLFHQSVWYVHVAGKNIVLRMCVLLADWYYIDG